MVNKLRITVVKMAILAMTMVVVDQVLRQQLNE